MVRSRIRYASDGGAIQSATVGAGRTFTSVRVTDLSSGRAAVGGKGEAAFWLPFLAIFSGARLNELAPLSADDVKLDAASGVRFITIIEDQEAGRSVKTDSSVRAVPIHPELIRIGLLDFVDHVRRSDGQSARLFPKLTPGPKGGFGEAFSKWFGATSVTWVSTTRATCFIRFAMASMTPCALPA